MKKTITILLRSVNDVKNLVKITEKMSGDVTMRGGRYHVDAKSAIGIYVLDFSKPLSLEIEKWKDEYEAALEPFRV